MPKSGKTSVAQVVFKKQKPDTTLYLEKTFKVQKMDIVYVTYFSTLNISSLTQSPMLDLQLWDLPSNYDYTDDRISHETFSEASCMIYVIDALVCTICDISMTR